MKFHQQRQSGFTLVEIAIVLVIIGLLLGGVLKGQEMIDNSRMKSVAADLRGVSAAYNSYTDRFRSIPGDETVAVLTARGWAAPIGGNGNGVLAITPAQTFGNGGEQRAMWYALRTAGFAGGDPQGPATVAGLSRSGVNTPIGVSVGDYGLPGPSACVSGLTTKQARGVDTILDGSEGNSVGEARATTGAANPLAPTAAVPAITAYNETTVLTLWSTCRPL